MRTFRILLASVLIASCAAPATHAGQRKPRKRPYRLRGLYKRGARLIWGAECRQPEGKGLAFGGQHQDADDGRPHTRVLAGGTWKAIHKELRAGNSCQKLYDETWALRNEQRKLLARARHLYFKGLPAAEETKIVRGELKPALEKLVKRSKGLEGKLDRFQKSLESKVKKEVKAALKANDSARQEALTKAHWHESGRLFAAGKKLLDASNAAAEAHGIIATDGITATAIKKLHHAQMLTEKAAEALDAEPPPRTLSPLVYDAKTKLYVLFGGDHFDYLTNDTWVFDPAKKKWFQRSPKGAPPPRGNHKLTAAGDGKVKLSGGYKYASNTDYCGGQYLNIDDGEWVYDVEKNTWTGGGKLVSPDSREYRTGPFHPDFYLQGAKPSAAAWEAKLKSLPANEWTAANPPYRPKLNRDWGTAIIDPDRDMILRWSGGHSAHGGTDVPHYHFATNRWELPFPVEFPLDCLYSNTTYPSGFNFNLRPWMTGHTYNNYNYDPPSRKMVKAGRPRHFYVYDPDVGDWVSRGRKPKAMSYGSCFYTLTLAATKHGAVCWGQNARVHLFEHKKNAWKEIKLSGDKLPGSSVDNSTICYDSRRDRVLMIRKPYGKAPYAGQVYALDVKSGAVKALSPKSMSAAGQFAYIDRACYDAANDVMFLASYLRGAGLHTRTPAFDCAGNRWVTLGIKYKTGKRGRYDRRYFPHGRSAGVMYDAKRKLLWGTDTNSQVYVLRLDAGKAGMKDLEAPPAPAAGKKNN